MTGFNADWLALREPFDAAARALAWPTLSPLVAALRRHTTADAAAPLRVLDLACGSGTNLRALAPRLGGQQSWRLVDHDPALLAALPQAMASWAQQQGYRFDSGDAAGASMRIAGPGFAVDLHTQCADLGSGLDTVAIDQHDLITASALLDLASARWIDTLVHHASGAGAAVFCALTVAGRIEWDPPDAADAQVHRLFALHQQRDKGFGPALGPAAGAFAIGGLAATHYAVLQANSDWVIDAAGGAPNAQSMLIALLQGMADAAIAQQPDAGDLMHAWQGRRMAMMGRTQLRVGHVDFMAMPALRPGPDPTTGRRASQSP